MDKYLTKLISVTSQSLDEFVSNFETEIKEMEKVIYIFKVMALVDDIKHIHESSRDKYNDSTIRISKVYDIDIGWFLRTGVRFDSRYNYHSPTEEVNSIFQRLERLKHFDSELASSQLEDYKEYVFKFSEYESIKNLLLSKEVIASVQSFVLLNELNAKDLNLLTEIIKKV